MPIEKRLALKARYREPSTVVRMHSDTGEKVLFVNALAAATTGRSTHHPACR
jgi:hypothetical protein